MKSFSNTSKMQFINYFSKSLIALILALSCLMVLDNGNVNIANIDKSFVINVDDSINISDMMSAKQNDNIWVTISNGFKLDHKENSKPVKREIHKLLADQDKLYYILQASSPYIYFIHEQTIKRHLPAELALIPVIESEFNPNDHSNKGATGLWQFMAGTARELGIQMKADYDGRRNVITSTKLALAYFNDLGTLFKNNWYLAIAAYNCGQGKVLSVERRTGSHNFWKLPLPSQTRYYVPKLLAVAAIVKNPAKYGVKLPPVNNAPYFATIKVHRQVSLKQVAKSSGINIKTLKKLNPDYKNGTIPKQKKGATLLVPVNKAEIVKAKIRLTN